MIESKKIRTASFLLACAVTSLCNAARAEQIPSTAQPGVLLRSLEKQSIEPTLSAQDIIVIQKGKNEAGDLSEDKAFTLQSLTLEGSTLYGQEAVNDVIRDYVGKQTSFADLNAIGARLTAMYRNDGYIFSRVIVPPQKIKDGVVHLKALEGRVTDVKIVGTYKDDNHLIKDMAEKIKASVPTNEKDIERYLLLINDLPGIKARGVISPSQTPGGGELTITIEQKDLEGSVGIDNRGSRNLGPFQATAIAAANSLFGIHDRTTVRVISTTDAKELMYGEITHEEQLGTEGANVVFRYARTRSRPGDNLAYLDIKGNSDNFDAETMYPLLRSRHTNVNLLAGFNSLGSESSILGIKTVEDRVRSLRIGSHVDFTDSWAGITQVEAKVIKGLSIFDATPDGAGRSNINGKHDFLRTDVSATRVQDLWDKFSLQVSGHGQYTQDPLLSSEQFLIGGQGFGRAYDSGELTGDQGIVGAVELRYGEETGNRYIPAYQFFTYYDSGRVWNLNSVVGQAGTDAISSAGGGVRFNLDYDISGSFELDKPLTRQVSAEGNKDTRIFFSLLKRF